MDVHRWRLLQSHMELAKLAAMLFMVVRHLHLLKFLKVLSICMNKFSMVAPLWSL